MLYTSGNSQMQFDQIVGNAACKSSVGLIDVLWTLICIALFASRFLSARLPLTFHSLAVAAFTVWLQPTRFAFTCSTPNSPSFYTFTDSRAVDLFKKENKWNLCLCVCVCIALRCLCYCCLWLFRHNKAAGKPTTNRHSAVTKFPGLHQHK